MFVEYIYMNNTTSKRHAETLRNWNIPFQLKKQNTYWNGIDNLALYRHKRVVEWCAVHVCYVSMLYAHMFNDRLYTDTRGCLINRHMLILLLFLFLVFFFCQKNISTLKLELLGNVSRYNLYYSLIYLLKWKPFGLEICTYSYYLVFIFLSNKWE